MKSKKNYKFYLISLLKFAPYILLLLIISLLLFVYNSILDPFSSLEKDTTNITNLGFAILIAISSVLFSWAREEEAGREKRDIKLSAILSLYTAIIFILSSGLKYAILYETSGLVKKFSSFFKGVHQFLLVHNFFLFTGVIFCSLYVTIRYFMKNLKF